MMENKADIRDYDWEDLPGVDYEHLHDIPEDAKNTEPDKLDQDFLQDTKLGACGKRCYTFRQAREIINWAPKQSRRGKYKDIPKREYWCPVCKAYHVTHHKSDHYDRYDGRKES